MASNTNLALVTIRVAMAMATTQPPLAEACAATANTALSNEPQIIRGRSELATDDVPLCRVLLEKDSTWGAWTSMDTQKGRG